MCRPGIAETWRALAGKLVLAFALNTILLSVLWFGYHFFLWMTR